MVYFNSYLYMQKINKFFIEFKKLLISFLLFILFIYLFFFFFFGFCFEIILYDNQVIYTKNVNKNK